MGVVIVYFHTELRYPGQYEMPYFYLRRTVVVLLVTLQKWPHHELECIKIFTA